MFLMVFIRCSWCTFCVCCVSDTPSLFSFFSIAFCSHVSYLLLHLFFVHLHKYSIYRTRHNSSVRAPEVKFNYLQEEETRVAFIIDTNDSTEKNIIQAALTRFQSTIKGTEYAHECIILDLKSSQEFHNGDPLTFDRPSDMKAVIWGKEVNEAINLHNIMIDLNRRLFDQRLKQDVTADVILITSGNITNTNTEALERIAETIKRLQLDFKVIIYPYRSASAIHSLRTLVNMVNGKLFLIPDSSSAVVSLMRLYDAFDYMLPTNDMLIHRQEFNSGDNNINFGFEIDKSVTGSTKLVAQLHHSSAGEDIFGPSLTLLKPDNRKFTSKSSGVELAHGFVVPLHKHSSDTGKWELHFERKSNKSLMIGSAYVRSPSKSDVITAKCILSEATDSLPPAVHVFVSTNGPLKLIQDAQVDVTLTSDDQIVKTFPLYDDGLANPDVTQGDGIYSRYLYEANRLGFYGVEVRVKSKVDQTKYYEGCRDVAKMTCCGSSVPNITLFGSNEKPEKIFHLQRIVNCGFLYVKRDFNPEDHVDRISDLKVEGVSKSERQVSVSFTAPSRSTSMTASIFTDSQYDRIREHFDEGTPVSPGYDFSQTMPRRDRETRNNYKLSSHHWSEGIYHLAIRVGEPNGHHKISNIITFFMPTDPSKLTTEGKHFCHFSLLKTLVVWFDARFPRFFFRFFLSSSSESFNRTKHETIKHDSCIKGDVQVSDSFRQILLESRSKANIAVFQLCVCVVQKHRQKTCWESVCLLNSCVSFLRNTQPCRENNRSGSCCVVCFVEIRFLFRFLDVVIRFQVCLCCWCCWSNFTLWHNEDDICR